MSLQFNNIDEHSGIIQGIEDALDYNPGEISGSAFLMKKFTAKVNSALDQLIAVIIKVSGKSQVDDSNHDDFNIVNFDIVSGQRAYTFDTDEQGNKILSILKIFRAQEEGGKLEAIDLIDPVFDKDIRNEMITDGQETQGIPEAYDKIANGIMFDKVPNYNAENGGLAYILREGSYFTTADTDKKPGFTGVFDRWFVVVPVLEDATIRLPAKRVQALQVEKAQLMQDIKDWYGVKDPDEEVVIQPQRIDPRTGRTY